MTDPAPTGIRVLVLPGDDKAYLRRLTRQPGPFGEADAVSQLVGGMIESIGLTNEAVMYTNEESKIEGLPANGAANRLFARGQHRFAIVGDYLAGPAVIVGLLDAHGHNDGANHDVPQSILDLCTQAGIEIVDQTASPQP